MRYHAQRRAYYENIIQRSLYDLYRKMEHDIEPLPETVDLEDKDQALIAGNVWSIEEEWIIDPKQRKSLSLIQEED
jgi:hypothetical protein